jgi:NAD(P)-dependent dehydrogenase (short-subunit alcohol dehydrogenase family)
MITSRDPEDALSRYGQELDFEEWKERLTVCPISLDLRTVESQLPDLLRELDSLWPDGRLDILVHNAAQTISYDASPGESSNVSESRETRGRAYPPDGWFLPLEVQLAAPDRYGRLPDRRDRNSWTKQFGSVEPEEAKQVLLGNAWAPFVLNQALLPRLRLSEEAYVLHVHAREGMFSTHKSLAHTHTNVAKAALAMMTRCLAGGGASDVDPDYVIRFAREVPWATNVVEKAQILSDFARKQTYVTRTRPQRGLGSNIQVHGVNPGWFSLDEYLVQDRVDKRMLASPIDEIDAAARVLYPVWRSAESFMGTWSQYIPTLSF